MSTGGIFTIITNDGKQDRMLMATAFLHDRLAAINLTKLRNNPGTNANDLVNLPTLLDIERTHALFTNAHFKPFAAIGFEYNKVNPTSGNPSLGQTIQFSIPQFGDFFHDIVCHAVLTQPTLTSTAASAQNGPAMRWCSFPGERLLQLVQQEVNGNPLDEYTFHATNMYREFRVQPNKRLSWNRCMGQEEPLPGFVRQNDWAANGGAPANSRYGMNVYHGDQTPSGQKVGNLELFIPLLFWYNKDVRLAVPSVAIPYGQRFINITLASQNQLVGLVPRGSNLNNWANPAGTLTYSVAALNKIELYINNIFVNPEVHKIYIKRIGFSLIRVHKQQLYNATSSSAQVLLQQLKWPIEYLYVGMKITKYYASSSTADQQEYLANWQSFSQVTYNNYFSTGQNVAKYADLVNSGTVAIVVDTGALTLPVGTTWSNVMTVGDTVEIRGARYGIISGTTTVGGAEAVVVSPAPAAAVAAVPAAQCFFIDNQGLEVVAPTKVATMDTISITAHGINIYQVLPCQFFNSYTPYHYGGPNITSPDDIGALLIPFCLYPGTYQPSGHINVSRAREFYLNYTSSVISSNNPGTLVVIASAINFLLISDGSAVLRYST
jgi:hypothetical protein